MCVALKSIPHSYRYVEYQSSLFGVKYPVSMFGGGQYSIDIDAKMVL